MYNSKVIARGDLGCRLHRKMDVMNTSLAALCWPLSDPDGPAHQQSPHLSVHWVGLRLGVVGGYCFTLEMQSDREGETNSACFSSLPQTAATASLGYHLEPRAPSCSFPLTLAGAGLEAEQPRET